MTTPQSRYQDPRADQQVLSRENGQLDLIGIRPEFVVPPPLFGRPPLSVRQRTHRQTGPGSLRNGARPGLEVPGRQQRDGAPSDSAIAQVPGPLADFGARAISFLIDYVVPVIVVSVALVLGVATGSLVLTVAGWLGLGAFGLWNSCYLQGTSGRSVGRRVAATMLVAIETGRPIGFGRALLRQFCHSLEFFIGFLRPLWDAKRQTFADKISGTVVIRFEGVTERRSGRPS